MMNEKAPPEKYADCNGWVGSLCKCRILMEPLCLTRGACKFYKAKEEKEEEES